MTAEQHPRIRAGVLVLAATAVLLRAALALGEAPGGGDPSYSYAYRAVLLLDGQWDALWLMWHPPGQPIAMALISAASFGWLAPWWAGILLTLASTAGLILVVDRLLASRVACPSVRLVAAALLTTQESLVHWARMPLTEPLFLFLVFLAIQRLDRDDISARDAVVAGAWIGLASLFRFEGAMAFGGLGLYLVWRTRSWRPGLALAAGWVATAGWMFANVTYVLACAQAQRAAYTIPAAEGIIGQLARIPPAVHHALTVWMPNVMILPFWMLAAIGIHQLHETGPDSTGRRLNGLILAVVGPISLAVIWSVMHKRTGAALVPPLIVWTTVALDVILARATAGARARRILGVVAFVVAAVVMDASRLAYAQPCEGCLPEAVSREVAVLRTHGAEPGPIFAFGSEPSIYGLLGWPERFEYWERRRVYGELYTPGEPDALVASLRARGVRYLVFVVPPSAEDTVRLTGWLGHPPARADLMAIGAAPERYGLRPVGVTPSADGDVHVYEIHPLR